ncbi:hypothetical protein ES705_50017 [subsurface metagenome]
MLDMGEFVFVLNAEKKDTKGSKEPSICILEPNTLFTQKLCIFMESMEKQFMMEFIILAWEGSEK